MAVEKETTRRVAHLARISVTEAELETLSRDLSRILAFAEQLEAIDVEGVEPMTSVTPIRLKQRDDSVTDGNRRADVLANAPDAVEGFYAVPKVVE
jgi:aspartyl-tRNA(Asn)/glutamyl-tRNA(Gln) amidotransferase subunit C